MRQESKRIPSSERRGQILAVAAELFARQGFHGTTTRQIAERVGVKETILFRLFPSKEDLYWSVIDQKCRQRPGRAELENQIATVTDKRAFLTGLAHGILERNRQDATLMRLVLFSGLEAHELSSRFFKTYIAGYYEELAKYVRQRIKAGEFRDVDPLLAARSFLGMVNHYLMVQELFGGKRYHKYDNQLVAETLTAIWLEGMKTR
jgi:AcrR family transcriptional regulator